MQQEIAAPDQKPKPRSRRSRLLNVLKWIVIVIVILGAIGAIYQKVASDADRRNFPPVGQMVSIGDYSLHLDCVGQGSPTVVLMHGSGNMYAVWDLVQTPLSASTRVCSYDRAGVGWSDYPPQFLTMQQHVEQLHTLLTNAGETGPYILVGHSIGGIEARTYYQDYPQDVRGMVLVESAVENEYNLLPSIIKDSNQSAGAIFGVCEALAPLGLIRLLGLGNAQASSFVGISDDAHNAMVATFNRTENCRGIRFETEMSNALLDSGQPANLGNLPLIVMTRGLDEVQASPGAKYSPQQAEQFQAVQTAWEKLQAGLVALSTNSRQVIAEKSGHFIHTTQPDLVIKAIQDVIAESVPQ